MKKKQISRVYLGVGLAGLFVLVLALGTNESLFKGSLGNQVLRGNSKNARPSSVSPQLGIGVRSATNPGTTGSKAQLVAGVSNQSVQRSSLLGVSKVVKDAIADGQQRQGQNGTNIQLGGNTQQDVETKSLISTDIEVKNISTPGILNGSLQEVLRFTLKAQTNDAELVSVPVICEITDQYMLDILEDIYVYQGPSNNSDFANLFSSNQMYLLDSVGNYIASDADGSQNCGTSPSRGGRGGYNRNSRTLTLNKPYLLPVGKEVEFTVKYDTGGYAHDGPHNGILKFETGIDSYRNKMVVLDTFTGREFELHLDYCGQNSKPCHVTNYLLAPEPDSEGVSNNGYGGGQRPADRRQAR